MSLRATTIGLILLLGGGRAVSLGAQAGSLAAPPRAGADTAGASEGERLFVASGCTACHGARGEGGPMGPPLATRGWLYGGSDDDLFLSISGGRPDGMPGWGERLSEEQIWTLVAYIRRLRAGR
jgi:cytochrome c oxidase cbb3-type subunit III